MADEAPAAADATREEVKAAEPPAAADATRDAEPPATGSIGTAALDALKDLPPGINGVSLGCAAFANLLHVLYPKARPAVLAAATPRRRRRKALPPPARPPSIRGRAGPSNHGFCP